MEFPVVQLKVAKVRHMTRFKPHVIAYFGDLLQESLMHDVEGGHATSSRCSASSIATCHHGRPFVEVEEREGTMLP
jgi:hypothetical protein